MKNQTLIPLGTRVLISRTVTEPVSKGGIVLPDGAQEKPREGVVQAVGWTAEEALRRPQPGDRVLLPKYGGTEVLLNDEVFTLIEEADILGILREKGDASVVPAKKSKTK